MRKLFALISALALTLSLAGGALAATTADVAESFTVASNLSLTLDKSSISYGTLAPGATSADQAIVATIDGNQNWTLNVSGTAFARTGGGSLPGTFRLGHFGTGTDVAGPWSTAGAAPVGTPVNATFTATLALPSVVMAGVYTGTLTFSLIGS